jgi:hypothetical protein
METWYAEVAEPKTKSEGKSDLVNSKPTAFSIATRQHRTPINNNKLTLAPFIIFITKQKERERERERERLWVANLFKKREPMVFSKQREPLQPFQSSRKERERERWQQFRRKFW